MKLQIGSLYKYNGKTVRLVSHELHGKVTVKHHDQTFTDHKERLEKATPEECKAYLAKPKLVAA